MKAATLIFPHQLFKEHPSLQDDVPVILVEEELFFNQYNFNKNKLVLHRASMKGYEEFLSERGFETIYVEASDARASVLALIQWLAEEGCSKLLYAELSDNWLKRRLNQACAIAKISVQVSESCSFLTSLPEANQYFDRKNKYFMASFYIDQRKKMRILVDVKDQPAGGAWSYDVENRLKFPAKTTPPVVHAASHGLNVSEAQNYVERNYGSNYGSSAEFIYPTNFAQAEKWLDDFLETRFEKFGTYEDAIVKEEHYLHHSVLSPLLNTGLLTPRYVVDRALKYGSKHHTPLNSLEGFIRQVIGWREFVRIVYEREGVRQRTKNYWGFTRKIPASFWDGTTGIEPVDNVIKKVLNTGYSHHIERLMVMGNFMILCEFNPDQVYLWFMEMYIDAYDWVMVPNVYGMTQFADGGLMTTKPYISGSNYLLKMSNYTKGPWTIIWDALFWRFMNVHRNFFEKNPRLGMLLRTFDKMPVEKKDALMITAEEFLSSLDRLNMTVDETN